MNKKLFCIIIFLFIVALFCSYASATNYKWDISLQQPMPSLPDTLFYSDDFINITFSIGETHIGFSMRNKTDSGIKINWDEMAYISPAGVSMRVIRSEVRYIDRHAPQTPTIVPPKSIFSALIVPTENIYYLYSLNRWMVLDLLPLPDKVEYKEAEFGVYMPLEIKGERKEYTFTFKIKKVTEVEK